MSQIKLSSIFKISSIILCLYCVLIHATPYDNPADENTEIKKFRNGHNARLTCDCSVVALNATAKWKKLEDSTTDLIVKNETQSTSTVHFTPIKNKDNGTLYECSCLVKGNIMQRKRTVILVTDKPELHIGTVKPIKDGQVYINWTVNDHNEPVTDYSIEYQSNDTWETFTADIKQGDTSVIVNGLESDTYYKFRLTATNAIGESDLNTTTYVKTLPKGPEYIPKIVRWESTNTTIVVELEEVPSGIMSSNYYYNLLVVRSNETWRDPITKTQLNDNRGIPIEDLEPETSYKIKIQACPVLGSQENKDCGSSWSEEKLIQTKDETGKSNAAAGLFNPAPIIIAHSILSYFVIKYLLAA